VKYSSQYEKMTQAPVTKLVVTLGIPTTLSMLVTNIYNMVDTMFVGKLGNSASGAVGIVFGFMAILQAFGFMFGQGAGSIISRKLGSRETETATKIASTSFFCAFLAGLIIEIFGLIFMEPMIYLLGSTDTILPYAKQYVFFILLAAPFMASGCVLNNILRYEGKAAMAMIGLLSGAVLNMLGDPLFMFVFNLGVRGAGLSTALSQLVSFSILLFMFISGRTQSKISIKYVTRNIKDVLEIAETGFPSLVRQGLSSISTMVLNGQAALYGDEAVAAMSIVSRICMFIFSVGLGIGQGFQPVSGFNYGAGKYSRVKKAFFSTLLISECLIGTAAILGICFSGHAIEIFRNDAQVISIGTRALRYQCIGLLFQPLCLMANMTLQSTGYKGGATFLSMLRSGLYFIPAVLILSHMWGLKGIESAQTFADILSFATAVPFMTAFFKRLPKDNS
jgi:putative MATE family efflux protein